MMRRGLWKTLASYMMTLRALSLRLAVYPIKAETRWILFFANVVCYHLIISFSLDFTLEWDFCIIFKTQT